MNDLLVRWVQYNNWANAKLVETAEQLDAITLMSGRLSKGSAFETLRHVLDVEWSWRMFCIGSDTGDALIWDVEPLDDLPSVKARWRQEGEDMLRYVQSLSEDELEEVYRQRSLLKRSVYPEDIAEAVYYFASDLSAKSTGNILNVDAGNAVSFTR